MSDARIGDRPREPTNLRPKRNRQLPTQLEDVMIGGKGPGTVNLPYRHGGVEYIGRASLLENYNSPPYFSLDRNWRNATSFPLCPADSEIERAVPKVFDGLILDRGIVGASPLTTPSTAIYDVNNSRQESSDVSQSYRVSLNLFLCLESGITCCIHHSSKPANAAGLVRA